jgi:hypothetical protein
MGRLGNYLKALSRSGDSQPIQGFCVDPSLTVSLSPIVLAASSSATINVAEWTCIRFTSSTDIGVVCYNSDNQATMTFTETALTMPQIYILPNVTTMKFYNGNATTATITYQGN